MRPIDADELIESIRNLPNAGMHWFVSAEAVFKAIINAPTIEPPMQPDIVRCKDCKFYTKMRTDLKTGICSLACRHLGDDGFCSEAERRTDGM